jgi:hypothetical protein
MQPSRRAASDDLATERSPIPQDMEPVVDPPSEPRRSASSLILTRGAWPNTLLQVAFASRCGYDPESLGALEKMHMATGGHDVPFLREPVASELGIRDSFDQAQRSKHEHPAGEDILDHAPRDRRDQGSIVLRSRHIDITLRTASQSSFALGVRRRKPRSWRWRGPCRVRFHGWSVEPCAPGPSDSIGLSARMRRSRTCWRGSQGEESRSPSFLSGLLFDDRGNLMSPSHVNKKGVRYRYYVRKRPFVAVFRCATDARLSPKHRCSPPIPDRNKPLIWKGKMAGWSHKIRTANSDHPATFGSAGLQCKMHVLH